MVTATLTRPTTISPVTTRSARIKFQDAIDIESMHHPKSRVITLEPLSKRGRVRIVKPSSSVTTHTNSSTGAGTVAGRLTRNNTQNSTTSQSTNSIGNPPTSPVPSEETTATSPLSIRSGSPNRKASPHQSDDRSNTTSSSTNTITATAELPRHGTLPGDTIPIRISIVHSKSDVRGMVIATLFRLARIDMHPPLPMPNRSGKTKKMEYEDVYPKSRTGLGGLYFSAASPNSAFRKDLAQSSTMMIVNPNTLTADISTSLKVPDAAFPTITNVPGGMISFTYHVEVVIDLFGKLGETRLWPRLTSSEPTFSESNEAGNQITSEWSNHILDTSPLRRSKSVITFEMSIVVGTHDSGRKRRLQKQVEVPAEPPEPLQPEDWDDQQYPYYPNDQLYDEMGYPYQDEHGYEDYDYDYGYYDHNYTSVYPTSVPGITPPPQVEEEVDEKTRLRRQEQLLYPSEPPQEGSSSTSATQYAPTAPDLSLETTQSDIDPHNDGTVTPSTLHPAASVAESTRSGDTVRPSTNSPPAIATPSEGAEHTDDKQELERRRLMAQVSAPPVDDETHASSSVAPSAPVITEHDYSAQTLHYGVGVVDLPQYQR
jgi:arrestin-related trafficking adapter 9